MTFNNKYAFSTYAYAVIKNELNMYIRRHVNRMYKHTVSIETPITDDLTLEDTLEDTKDYIEDLIDRIDIIEIREIFDSLYLSDRDKRVLEMLFQGRTQTEIAIEIDVSQTQISRIRQNIIKRARQIYKSRERRSKYGKIQI